MAMPCIAGAACVSKSAFDRADLQAPSIAASQLGQIEAAGLKLTRVRGIVGAQFVGKRMRKASEATASIDPAWLTKAMVSLPPPVGPERGVMLLTRADFHINEAIGSHVRSYLTAYVPPAELELRRIEAERALEWERRTVLFGDVDWTEPRRRS